MRKPLTPGRSVLLVLGGLLAGCAAGSGGSSGPTGPRDGSWEGPRVSFELKDGELSSWQVHDVTCSDLSDSGACLQTAHDPPEVTATLLEDGTFVAALGSLTLTGEFSGAEDVSGTWTFLPHACCSASGTWTARWVPPEAPPPAPDAGGGGTEDSLLPEEDSATVGGTTGTGTGGEVLPPPTDGYFVPPDASAAQQAAITRTNWYRLNVGVDLIDMHAAINAAAQAHADYYSQHKSAYATGKVPGGAHAETPDIPTGFTGKSFGDRMSAAGYEGSPGFEVMAFMNSPAAAVDGWVETVYHRIPFVSPDMAHAGYGGAPTVDVMDFGFQAHPDKSLAVLYPWPGQTGVPRSWSGNESPQPPPPPNGYPSGSVITVTTAQGAPLTIDVHRLLAPDGAEIAHVWHPKGSNGFMSATWALYAHDKLQAGTTYTVELEGTHGASSWSREWSFTTAGGSP